MARDAAAAAEAETALRMAAEQSAQASALNALAARRQLTDALAALEAAEAQAAEAKAEASAEKARSAAAQRAAEMATSKAEVAISKAEVAISRAAELEEEGRAAAAQRVEVERRAAVAEQAAADAGPASLLTELMNGGLRVPLTLLKQVKDLLADPLIIRQLLLICRRKAASILEDEDISKMLNF
jgi:flagellar biosynthesis GTPase FlhF